MVPHCSALDGPAIACALKGKVSFVAGDFLKKWPLFGFVARSINCIFVPRGGTPEALTKTLNLIAGRQKALEEKGEYNPIVIFPEGTCSNNTCLMPFKKGSFYSLLQCHPVSLKYKGGNVRPSISVCAEDLAVFIYMCHYAPITIEVTILPAF